MIGVLLKKKELLLVKFPIIFPLIYISILYLFPNFETFLIFFTILLLAETHFGATWPFLLDKVNHSYILNKKNIFFFIPFLIIIISLIGFFLYKNIFFLVFFAANVFHVTRQSFGICKLYCKNHKELKFQENMIYFFNLLFFLVSIFRFFLPIINESNIFLINLTILLLLFFIFSFYINRYGFTENFLTFFTGSIIFLPACFVENPIHVILLGVTMHYSQYIYLTSKIQKSRNIKYSKNYMNKYLLIISLYAIVMSIFSLFGKFENEILKDFLIIPIIGQMLHFYFDSQLWKFSEKHNRINVLSYLK